jgi:hypothetical protein
MMSLLKLSFDQNLIIINHKLNDDFNSYIIFLSDLRRIQEEFITL